MSVVIAIELFFILSVGCKCMLLLDEIKGLKSRIDD